MIFFPLATIGRDMCGQLFSMAVLNYILFTKNLSVSQFSAVSFIIVAARLFDAFNDPFMGTLIDHTKTSIGKFKPWIIAGVISTSLVVYFAFANSFTGWSFVGFFALIYFLFSICFTMNDVSYWGMIPSLSSDPEKRDKYTSRTVFTSGMGAAFVTVLVPFLTAGDHVIGGNAVTAYKILAIVACAASPITMLLLCFVKENRGDGSVSKDKISVLGIFRTVFRNDQLKWISLVFFIGQLGTAPILNGLGTTYVYFEFGYNGLLATFFVIVGMSSTVFLMLIYPSLAKKYSRRKLVDKSIIFMSSGYLWMLLSGLLLPHSSIVKFIFIVIGLAIANIGSYCVYLICMICISNSIEYNEYKFGSREDGVITSVRPFLTKLSNSFVMLMTSVLYMMIGVTKITNLISDVENQASSGAIDAAEKSNLILSALENVKQSQTFGLLVAMTLIALVMGVVSCIIFRKKYTLDEEEYLRITNELETKKQLHN
ncbi:MAG: MFS transporter [Clostridia bacterium]|nr:MFS transporter [Clostridia bacterium]